MQASSQIAKSISYSLLTMISLAAVGEAACILFKSFNYENQSALRYALVENRDAFILK
jgi:hypothetical protein